jgi:hypothetical protein
VTRPKRSIDERLLAAQVAIDNALGDAPILAALAAFGYDAARLGAGRALYEDALALVNAQKAEYGDQYEASAAVRAAWDAADAAYSASLKVARVALQDDPKAHAALMLGGARKQSLSGWIEQATAFYTNLLGDAGLMAAMAAFGYTQAKLEAEQALVQAVVAANLAQEKEKGEAQDATKQRDAKLDALDAWMSDFKAIAQVALEENAQWLEKLGFGSVP